ncbi:Threonylcarbamoyl-AMP synthase [Thalassocella blandensis]|nr:Threonylcarbamoyl-AMP synthase [Thalassocella blandensis]
MWQQHPRIKLCAEHVQLGGVIAYPTEAVWGLGCDPFDEQAVADILCLKTRPVEKGLILIAGNVAQIEFLLEGLSPEKRQTLLNSWPGPFTWLIPHHHRIPAMVSGRHATIAVRVSAHPVVQALCNAVGGPIVSTSANPQGKLPATTSTMARRYFSQRSLLHASCASSAVVAGKSEVNVLFSPGCVGSERRPSEIRDLDSGQLIRAGT